MAKATILVIEDDLHIQELIQFNLEQHGYRVLTVADGALGLAKALDEKPALILLDLMLPNMDGLAVCKMIRQNDKTKNIPLVMLTAKSEEADIVLGLELGADDYVTKPFSPRQLVARVKALLRRSREAAAAGPIHTIGTLELDFSRHQVLLNRKPLALTAKEYGVLKLFIEAGGRALSREYILETLWGQDESLNVDLRAVDKHIGELRRKLKGEAHRILTIKHHGYRFETENDKQALT